MTFKANDIHIDPEAYNYLKTMLTILTNLKFAPLFTLFKNDGLAKLLLKDEPNRYVFHNEKSTTLVAEWNDLCMSIDVLLRISGFQKDVQPI